MILPPTPSSSVDNQFFDSKWPLVSLPLKKKLPSNGVSIRENVLGFVRLPGSCFYAVVKGIHLEMQPVVM